MKFDALYPHATLDDQYNFEGSFVFKGDTIMPCLRCGEDTLWIDGIFIGHLCSEECNGAMWDEYFRALSK